MINQNIVLRWINLITDIFSIVTIGAVGYFCVFSVYTNIGIKDMNIIGLALVWALQINSVISISLKILADTESNMNAVVRLY